MKSNFFISSLFILLVLTTACNKPKVRDVQFAMVLATDVIDDKDVFTALTSGAQLVSGRLGISAPVFNDSSALGFSQKVGQLIAEGYNFIVMHAPQFNAEMQSLVQNNQNVRFMLLNDTLPSNYPNLYHGLFLLEQPAFMAGFMAAYWADVQVGVDLENAGVVGLVGGDSTSYANKLNARTFSNGIDYYNKSNTRKVKLVQRWTNDERDSARAAMEVADMASTDKATVFIGMGGQMQVGVFYQAKALELFALGMNVDKAYLYPDYAPHIISSVVAATDVLIFNAVNQARYYDPATGRYNAALATGYVGMVRMTDFEGRFPPAVVQQVYDIQTMIQRGILEVTDPIRP